VGAVAMRNQHLWGYRFNDYGVMPVGMWRRAERNTSATSRRKDSLTCFEKRSRK